LELGGIKIRSETLTHRWKITSTSFL